VSELELRVFDEDRELQRPIGSFAIFGGARVKRR
jgi:hypothetical protein